MDDYSFDYNFPTASSFDWGSYSQPTDIGLTDWTSPSAYSGSTDDLGWLNNYSLPGVPAVTDYSGWGDPTSTDYTASDLNSYITDPSLWDQITGAADKYGGALGTVWDKLTAGSGANGSGPSLLSQLGSLGLGGLGMYGNYQQNEFNKDLETRRLDQAEAQLGLSRDNTMLAQQQARINAATDMAKTGALFDLIKQRQGVDLSNKLAPLTQQLTAQGWDANQGFAPVTSALGQFGVTQTPEPRPALAGIGAPISTATALAHGGQYMGGGSAQGALGLLAGGTAGQDDEINARLSDGEYVMDADVVAALGDGNTAAGAKKLDQMRENIRAHKRSAGPKSIPPKAKNISSYLKG